MHTHAMKNDLLPLPCASQLGSRSRGELFCSRRALVATALAVDGLLGVLGSAPPVLVLQSSCWVRAPERGSVGGAVCPKNLASQILCCQQTYSSEWGLVTPP